MKTFPTKWALIVALLATHGFALARQDDLLKRINDLSPYFDLSRRGDAAYVKAHETWRRQYQANPALYDRQRNDLIMQLYKVAPRDPHLPKLLRERWMNLVGKDPSPPNIRKVIAEINDLLAANPPNAVQEIGWYYRACLIEFDGDAKETVRAAEAFCTKFPKSAYAPQLLENAAWDADGNIRSRLFARIVREYPKFERIALIRGYLSREKSVGKPFVLKFVDGVTGRQVDVSTMRGHVILVNFWATWCEPCRAEMSVLSSLYREFQGKGLQILGVSLDFSPQLVKDYVAKNAIPWPQYVQGKRFDGAFSSGWGIREIPTTFLIDKKGCFVGSFDPRDAGFRTVLTTLLK